MNNPKPDPNNINCVDCSALNVEGCLECRRCPACGCRCKQCNSCEEKHHPKYFCKVCKKCKKYNSSTNQPECQCRTAPLFHKKEVEDGGSEANTLKRKLGLEIECSYIGKSGQLQLPKFVEAHWVHDGSVTQGGLELVVSPLFGDDFIRGVHAIAEELNKYPFAVDSSCGFHVHVGAEDFNPFTMRRLILMYHKYENLFYNLCAPGRDKGREVRNHRGDVEVKYYAKRWEPPVKFYTGLSEAKRSHDLKMFILKWLYGSRSANHMCSHGLNEAGRNAWVDMSDIKSHKYEKARYYGLNLHTWFQRQTVEYRHHEGTLSPTKLLMWPLWCGWFTHLASSLRDDEVEKLKTVADLIHGKWKRKFYTLELPIPVANWVSQTLIERDIRIA
jgi:hypothetical protein